MTEGGEKSGEAADGASDGIRAMRNDEAAGRYEAELDDGSVAVLDYRIDGGRIAFTHTGTPPRQRGRGIAGRLTRYALEDAVERGLELAPLCPFTAHYIREHPEFEAHLAEGFGG
jgi:predicted GNAT family acetyltransferase